MKPIIIHDEGKHKAGHYIASYLAEGYAGPVQLTNAEVLVCRVNNDKEGFKIASAAISEAGSCGVIEVKPYLGDDFTHTDYEDWLDWSKLCE